MTINGANWSEYAFKPAAATIIYSATYEAEQARLYAGVSITEWDALPGTPAWIDPETGGRSKSDLIMLWRISQWIPAAAQDAAAREYERQAKRHKVH